MFTTALLCYIATNKLLYFCDCHQFISYSGVQELPQSSEKWLGCSKYWKMFETVDDYAIKNIIEKTMLRCVLHRCCMLWKLMGNPALWMYQYCTPAQCCTPHRKCVSVVQPPVTLGSSLLKTIWWTCLFLEFPCNIVILSLQYCWAKFHSTVQLILMLMCDNPEALVSHFLAATMEKMHQLSTES